MDNIGAMKVFGFIFHRLCIASVMFIITTIEVGAEITVESYNIKTPNATDLGRYGEIPISYYTGRADISIPIYSTTQSGVPMNITLSYDASGMLMNTLPSWTGHAWTLNVGGVISRSSGEYWDEYELQNDGSYLYGFSNFFNSYSRLETDKNNRDTLEDNLFWGKVDYEADIFSFSFMGKSGRFILGPDGEWKVQSNDNLDVVFDYNDPNNFIYPFIEDYPINNFYRHNSNKQLKTIKGFTIIDDNGTRYEFGGTTDAIEYSIDFHFIGNGESWRSWRADSWYLSKVYDRNGNLVYDFTYRRGYFVTQVTNTQNFYSTNESGNSMFGGSFGSYSEVTSRTFPYSAILSAPVYLTSIVTQGGEIISFNLKDGIQTDRTAYNSLYNTGSLDAIFNPSTGCLRPSSIDNRYSYPYYYLQSCQFCPYKYPYSTGNIQDDPLLATGLKYLSHISINDSVHYTYYELKYDSIAPRMHLTDVNIYGVEFNYDKKNGKVGSYHFIYNDGWDLLPKDYLTTQVDHWGYYNGVATVMPTSMSDATIYYDSRSSNSEKTQYGLLNTIIYPTGGCTEFTFE